MWSLDGSASFVFSDKFINQSVRAALAPEKGGDPFMGRTAGNYMPAVLNKLRKLKVGEMRLSY
jgi:hypothetical protein